MLNGLFVVSLFSTAVELVQEILEPTETYVPKNTNLAHRDEDGKIVIENNELYYDDIMKYPPSKIRKWIEQGKYNLTPEELEKENERLKKEWEELYSY